MMNIVPKLLTVHELLTEEVILEAMMKTLPDGLVNGVFGNRKFHMWIIIQEVKE